MGNVGECMGNVVIVHPLTFSHETAESLCVTIKVEKYNARLTRDH